MVILVLVLILLVVLPVAWLASEFQSRRWLRILLGISSLSLSFFVAWVVGMLSNLQYNADYGHSSAQLIDTVIANLDSDHTDQLLLELKSLRNAFHPTYENRANYNELVADFVQRLESHKTGKPPSDDKGR